MVPAALEGNQNHLFNDDMAIGHPLTNTAVKLKTDRSSIFRAILKLFSLDIST
jgi:hypothetical protein